MPREQQEGHTKYKPLICCDFDKLSWRRQVIELPEYGMKVDTGDEAEKLYIKTDETMYPTKFFPFFPTVWQKSMAGRINQRPRIFGSEKFIL